MESGCLALWVKMDSEPHSGLARTTAPTHLPGTQVQKLGAVGSQAPSPCRLWYCTQHSTKARRSVSKFIFPSHKMRMRNMRNNPTHLQNLCFFLSKMSMLTLAWLTLRDLGDLIQWNNVWAEFLLSWSVCGSS